MNMYESVILNPPYIINRHENLYFCTGQLFHLRWYSGGAQKQTNKNPILSLPTAAKSQEIKILLKLLLRVLCDELHKHGCPNKEPHIM